MTSLIPGYQYDIFISYRQKDNKHDGWVTEFVDNLKGELESTFKEEISVYFDINPHDGLLETHDVDASLKEKLKCLIFIPIISRTYCDPKSFAWEHEFKAFKGQASQDQYGLKVRLPNGNVSSRVLPVQIHDLEREDMKLFEKETESVLRAVDFVFKTSSGVNRPLRANEDHPQDNLNKTYYRDQINKVANAIKEIIKAIKEYNPQNGELPKQAIKTKPEAKKVLPPKIIITSLIIMVLVVIGTLMIPKLFKTSEPIEKSIAVLPFVNLSNDPEQDYFSDGMVDEILNHLFKVGDLKVISRTSSMRYKNTKLPLKEVAHELGVSAILEGSVRKVGNNVRITVQLIDTKSDTHLWSESYDRDLADVFSIQSEVAQNVARELKATLTSTENQLIKNASLTSSQLAYDFFLKGNDYYSNSQYQLALDMYSKAIKEDSLFASAYALRAKIHLLIYWDKYPGWQGHDIKAMNDIRKGLQLNPQIPEVRFAQAIAYYHLNRDYDNSLKILKELKTYSPGMSDLYAWSSYNFRRQGKLEESISEAKQGIELDPFNAEYIENLLLSYQLLHQYDNQVKWSRHGLTLIPNYKTFNHHIFSAYLDITGDLKISLKESVLKEEDIGYGANYFSQSNNQVNHYGIYYYTRRYDKLIELIKNDTVIETGQTIDHPKTYELALIYYLNGNKSLCKLYADSAIVHLKGKIKESPTDERFYATLGKCYAFCGKNTEAISCGQKAVDLKPIQLDAYQGVAKEQDLMEINILIGNYDIAVNMIECLLSTPSWLSAGKLIIDPIFDNLRSLPRFQKIIDSTRMKQIVK